MSTNTPHVAQSPVPLKDAREIATPAATMRTYASPSGPSLASVAVWRTDMPSDAAGPIHTVSEDQVIVVMSGTLRVELDGVQHTCGPQDCIVLPAGAVRQISAGSDGATGLVASLPGATAQVGDAEPVLVPWAR